MSIIANTTVISNQMNPGSDNQQRRLTMPQVAIRGIYLDGKIIPTEDIPFHEPMNVIIVFTNKEDVESRYYQADWQLAEKQASEDYKTGKIRSADTIDEMFDMIAEDADGNPMVTKL